MQDLISILLHSVQQTHAYHLQTDKNIIHLALQDYYEGVGDLIDDLAEAYQGKYGIIKYKHVNTLDQYDSLEGVLNYFDKLLKIITKTREEVKEGFLLNTIDEIEALIYKTLYKLNNLDRN
jgi:DNA-binding ferritin-like protein